MTTLTQRKPITVPALNLSGALMGVVRFFESIAAAHQAARDFDRLNGMADETLARHGMTRSDASAKIMDRHFS